MEQCKTILIRHFLDVLKIITINHQDSKSLDSSTKTVERILNSLEDYILNVLIV